MEKERKSYYSVIPAAIRYDKHLTELEKLLYGEITSLCNEKGFCHASNEYFAEIYSKKVKTISRAISNISKRGYIDVKLDNSVYNNCRRRIFINVAKLEQFSLRFK